MKRGSKAQLYVHIKVLQSGATLASVEKPMRKESLKLESSGTGPLVLPHYPIPNNRYEFLVCGKNKATLIVDQSWEGFATSRGELKELSRVEKGHSTIEMGKGDYASITRNDLRIMIKLTTDRPKNQKSQPKFMSKSYRGSLINLTLGGPIERMGLMVGTLISAVIVGGFAFGLIKRPHAQPTSIADVQPEYSLQFVHPEHFVTAPEAMQKNYNRVNPIRSVVNYYNAVTENLIGTEIQHPQLLFPSSIDRSRDQHQAVSAELERYREHQKEIESHVLRRGGAAMVAIPAVSGETMIGSMRRSVDKVSIMHEYFRLALAERRAVTEQFPNIPEYSFDNYQTQSKTNDAMKQLGESVSAAFQPESSESVMYKEAANLGKKAENAQLYMKPGVTRFKDPIRFQHGGSFATYLTDVDFADLDERLRKLDGVPYSEKRQSKAPATPVADRRGTIAPALVERFINQHKFQLQICYEQSLRRNKEAVGEMEWRWTITPRGNVTDISLAKTTIEDKKLESCIREKMKSWQFPSPDRGSVEISYPFVFSPNKG